MPIGNQDVLAALHWWQVENGGVSCTICSKEQNVEWFIKFKELLENTDNTQSRLELFRIYDMVDNFLLDFHSLKMEIGNDLVNMYIKCYNGNYKKIKFITVIIIILFFSWRKIDQIRVEQISDYSQFLPKSHY